MAYYLIARHAAQGKDLDAFLRMMADAYKLLLSRVVRMRMSVDFPTRFGPSDNYSRCVWEIILKGEILSGCTHLLRGPSLLVLLIYSFYIC